MNDQPANLNSSEAIQAAASLDDLVRNAETGFQRQFGRPPKWIAAAPGRVNLIGEHTDYNDGFVLPMAIERFVVMAGDASSANRSDQPIRLFSTAFDEFQEVSLETSRKEDLATWARYIFGVMIGCRDAGLQVGPMDVLVEANVPLGGGLSSSAALEVATATLLEAATGHRFEKVEKGLLCQKAEHEYAGVPCGIMDQFTSVMGQADHLMLLDCRSTDTQMVPLKDPEIQVLIINTNVKHELTGGEYAERRGQCEQAAQKMGLDSLRDATSELLGEYLHALEPVFHRRARHVIGEIERTTQTVDALGAGDWPLVGKLMYESHASLRDDYEVSCAELDLLVELAQQQNSDAVIGSRMTGGGFGGCTVSLIRQAGLESVARSIRDQYHQRTGIEPTLFTTRPARGAHIIRG